MDIKRGQIYSETQFYTVSQVGVNMVTLNTDNNSPISVSQSYIKNLMDSADEVKETKKVTRTELAEGFKNATNVAVTVCYNKAVKEADIKKSLDSLKGLDGSAFTKAKNKLAKTITLGEERIMIGRHYGKLNDFGRIEFIDMEVERKDGKYDNRQVDPRTINWYICRGVKYIQK